MKTAKPNLFMRAINRICIAFARATGIYTPYQWGYIQAQLDAHNAELADIDSNLTVEEVLWNHTSLKRALHKLKSQGESQ